MKNFFVLIILFLFLSCGSYKTQTNLPSPPPKETIYYDEFQKQIPEDVFNTKWREDIFGLARWDRIENNIRIASLSAPSHSTISVDYKEIIAEIKK